MTQQNAFDYEKYRLAFNQWYTDNKAYLSFTHYKTQSEDERIGHIARHAWCGALQKIGHDQLDKSDAADAARFRWLLNGHGYFMEEEHLCGHGPCHEIEQDDTRLAIDSQMNAVQQDGAAQ
jgi:hypothetical protein